MLGMGLFFKFGYNIIFRNIKILLTSWTYSWLCISSSTWDSPFRPIIQNLHTGIFIIPRSLATTYRCDKLSQLRKFLPNTIPRSSSHKSRQEIIARSRRGKSFKLFSLTASKSVLKFTHTTLFAPFNAPIIRARSRSSHLVPTFPHT